jgi:iron complex outermembrane receptor protein
MASRTLIRRLALHSLGIALAIPSVTLRAEDENSSYAAVSSSIDEDSVAESDRDDAGRLLPAPGPDPELGTPRASVATGQMIGDKLTRARKRGELVQRAPVAVSGRDASQLILEDVRRLSDLDGKMPNFSIGPALGSANSARLTIRGVGQVENNSSFDPAVGVFVDGVYHSRTQGLLAPLFDVERVEVIRGPQGTLFGKNTIGGAVNIVTKEPTFELGADAAVRVGNFDQLDTRWTLNVPLLAERAALRFSAATNYDDGYQSNQFRDERLGNDRLLGGRTQLLLLPSDSVEVLLSGEYSRQDRRPRAGKCKVVGPAVGAIEFLEGPDLLARQFSTCAADEARGDTKFSSDFGAEDDLRSTSLTAQIAWDVRPGLLLTSITAYRDLDYDAGQDFDATELNLFQPPFPGSGDYYLVSQDLQLQGRTWDGRLVYEVGLFASGEEIDDTIATGASVLAPELQRIAGTRMDGLRGLEIIPIVEETRKIDNRSFGTYAQVSFAITRELNFSAGLRRTLDRRRLRKEDVTTGLSFGMNGVPVPAAGGLTIFGFEHSERFGDWSPNATLSYQLTPKVLTYASYATGSRVGGFNGRATSLDMDTATIDPEDLTTYEIGAKATFLDDRLLLNAASFYSIYSDIQRPILQASAIGVPITVFRNAAEARLRGLEIEAVALPFPSLRLETSLSAFRSRYTEFDAPMQPGSDDARLPDAPNYLMSFVVGYQTELWRLGSLSTRLQYTHRGTQANDTVDSRSVRSEKYGLLDGRLALELWDGKTEVALFGTNLLNRFYFTSGFDASQSVGVAVRFPGPPRRYGVELRRAF